MAHPIVELAKKEYFLNSHKNVNLITNKAGTSIKDIVFNAEAEKLVRNIKNIHMPCYWQVLWTLELMPMLHGLSHTVFMKLLEVLT